MVKVYNKLVRNKIPRLIQEDGLTCDYRILDEIEYSEHLDIKLAEELEEFKESRDVSELADMLEVLNAMADLYGYSFAEVEETRLRKKEEKGGFTKRIFLESAEVK